MVSKWSRTTMTEYWIYMLTVCINLHNSACQSSGQNQEPRIYSLHIRSDIKYRFATTQVTSKLVNPSNVSKETVFEVIIPNEAFISEFIMEFDGRIYPGQVQDKDKAKKQYQMVKRKEQSTRRNSQRPRETNIFGVDVTMSALSRITFNLTYQEVLRRRTGSYHHVMYLHPKQIVDDLRIDVSIQESRDITNLVVPPLRDDFILTEDTNITARNKLAKIERPTSKSSRIRYYPSVEDQRLRSEHGLNGLFVVKYDIARRLDAGDVLIKDGHFVHFFSPHGLEPIPKDILFILDVSTSMVGPKLKQLKDAMRRILNDLHQGDNFNIVLFNTGATFWKPGVIVPATRHNIDEAKAYIRRTKASGWTNINEALTFGVDFLNGFEEEGRSQVVLFLTDGRASTGEQNVDKILQNIKQSNSKQIPIFSLAFGKGADYEFVKKVSIQNSGVGRRIYEDSDAAFQIKRFYDEMSYTALQNVSFIYRDGSVGSQNLTKTNFNSFYGGSELIVAGKMNENKTNALSLAVSGTGAQGQIELSLTTGLSDQPDLIQTVNSAQITEKMWVYLTIQQLLEKAVGETNPEERDRLRYKASNLALKYKFVTPLTSMIVTKPDEQIFIDLEDEELFGQKLPSNHNSSGSDSSSGGSYQGGGGGDPHFMIRVKGIQHPICFDFDAKPGENIRLLKDRRRGITINAGIISSMSMNKYGFEKTFMGDVVVITKHFTLSVNTTHMFMNGAYLTWDTELPLKYKGANINIVLEDTSHRLLYVDLGHDVRIIIKRVEHNTVHYLNVFLDKEKGLSREAAGIIGSNHCPKYRVFGKRRVNTKVLDLIRSEIGPWSLFTGQFVRKKLKMEKVYRNNKGKVIGKIKVSEKGIHNKIKANLVSKPDIITGNHELCWSVHRSVKGLIDGEHSDYILKSVYSP